MLYSEDQKFHKKFFYTIFAISIVFFLFSLFADDIPLDSFQGNDLNTLPVAAVMGVFLSFLFLLMKLKIRIDATGIYFRFVPFHVKWYHLPFSEIEEAVSVTYRPIRDYGGRGIRYGWKKGKAYSLSGNKGIQIKTRKNELILFGTQHPEEFLKALSHAHAACRAE
ncbi:MAG TPA: hypothetical protein VJB99_03115 [Patescibacteria group bacterium]|nr:hypothetical protein [Patescibacteria group bacterium]